MFVDHGGLDRSQDPIVEAWEVALDRIELDLIRIERALASGDVSDVEEWDVPTLSGLLPESLRERATDLHERQRAVLDRLGEKVRSTVQQQAVADEVDRATGQGPSRPAYIDVTA